MKFSILIATVILLLFVNLNGHVIFNQVSQSYTEGDPPSDGISGSLMDQYTVEAGSSMLKSMAKFQMILSIIEEKAILNQDGKLQFESAEILPILDESIIHLENSFWEYKKLYNIAIKTPQKANVIEKLKDFNYYEFFIKRQPTMVFWEVAEYLQMGDTNAVLRKALLNAEGILIALQNLRTDESNLFNISQYYKINENFYKSILFGQYVAEIMLTL